METCIADERLEIQDARLSEVVARLVDAYRPEEIYLFGSCARGDQGPDSDYDIMVVVPDDVSPERKRSRLAYERLWGTGTSVHGAQGRALLRALDEYGPELGRREKSLEDRPMAFAGLEKSDVPLRKPCGHRG